MNRKRRKKKRKMKNIQTCFIKNKTYITFQFPLSSDASMRCSSTLRMCVCVCVLLSRPSSGCMAGLDIHARLHNVFNLYYTIFCVHPFTSPTL